MHSCSRLLAVVGGLLLAACGSHSTGGTGDGGTGLDGGNPGWDGGNLASDGGLPGSDGGVDAGQAPVLPANTLLYLRHTPGSNGAAGTDAIIARDLGTGSERVVTDLTGDGSTGWDVWGLSLSPDRRRIAFASLYGRTAEDTADGFSIRAIWTVATDGTDFRRLTPPTNTADSVGKTDPNYDISYPEWTADGSKVLYDFGEYWWENQQFRGGTFPWIVSAAGGASSEFQTPTVCSVLYPARNPATGEFLLIHSVCIPGESDGDGLYLYPAAGSLTPTQLVASAHVDGNVDVSLVKPAWWPDGSAILFVGGMVETNWAWSLLAYDLTQRSLILIATPPDGSSIYGVAVAPDASKLVYCLRQDDTGAEDLHLMDLTQNPVTDTAITHDGRSCDPVL